MRWKILSLLAVVWFLGACEGEQAVDGTYFELVRQDSTLSYDKPLAIKLDLFQFGNDAGGIVRYHSLDEVSGDQTSPFDKVERACFWTDRIRLDGAQTRFTLNYIDHRLRKVRMTFDRKEEGVLLEGNRGFKESQGAVEPLRLERQEDETTSPLCASRSNLTFELTLDNQLVSEARLELPPEDGGEGVRTQMRATIVWMGDLNKELADWTSPLVELGDLRQVAELTRVEHRSLPPGSFLADPDTLPFVTDLPMRVAMGIPIIYRASEQGETDANGEVVSDWDKGVEPMVGTPFRLLNGRMTGKVLLYVEGAGQVSNYDNNFFNKRQPVEGYQVIKVVFDEGGRIDDWEPVGVKQINLKGREAQDYEQDNDPAKEFPRLPPACRAEDCSE